MLTTTDAGAETIAVPLTRSEFAALPAAEQADRQLLAIDKLRDLVAHDLGRVLAARATEWRCPYGHPERGTVTVGLMAPDRSRRTVVIAPDVWGVTYTLELNGRPAAVRTVTAADLYAAFVRACHDAVG